MRTENLTPPAAALELAKDRVQVFAVNGKVPFKGTHGFYDATDNPEIISEMFARYPGANVAARTGQASGLVILDLDTKLAVKEALRRGVPDDRETYWVRTLRGWHIYFRTEEPIRCFDPFPGANFKAEGGYVVTPPSIHPSGKRYCLIPSLSGAWANVPDWLREKAKEWEERIATTAPHDLTADGPSIHEGERNSKLTSIAGWLHDGHRSLERLTADLLAINAVRCVPALPESEVCSIANKMHRRPPCKISVKVMPEILDLLDRYTLAVFSEAWRGSGLTDRDVLLAAAAFARDYGTMIPAGVRISISYRDLALAASVSLPTLRKAVKRLKAAGWLHQDNSNRKRKEAGAFVLLAKRAQVSHSPPEFLKKGLSVEDMRVPRLRWLGLGKKAEAVLDVMVAAAGTATVRELADMLHDQRPWELRRRQLSRLEAVGVVKLDGETVRLVENWEAHLLVARGEFGELERERADKVRYERERQAFHALPSVAESQNRHRERGDPADGPGEG